MSVKVARPATLLKLKWWPPSLLVAATLPWPTSRMRTSGSTAARIKMRYMPGVTAQDRVIHNGTIYGIESLIDVRSDHRELVLMCKG